MNDLVNLVNGWVRHFASADRELRWTGAEEEAQVWLTPNTLLMGRLDARGITADGEKFFGEWKTANPRERNTWKNVWRLNPQSLTYGVLADALDPGCRRFTVRKAFKSDPPSYDHAWFTYSDKELAMWREQVIYMADEIRDYMRDIAPWPLNLSNCFRYGERNVCPFFHLNCNQQDFTSVGPSIQPRVPHLDVERRLNGLDGKQQLGVVALDATCIKVWLDCRERFRREYITNQVGPPSEALTLGIEFHEAMGTLYKGMVR